MTVAHVYAGYVPSRAEGITKNVQGLVDALKARGEDVRLEAEPADLGALNRVRTHLRNARRGRRLVRRALQDPETRILHHHVNVAGMGLASRVRTRGARVLLHVWNAIYQGGAAGGGVHPRGRWKHRILNGSTLARLGTAHVDELIVSSQFQAAQFRSCGFERTIHVISNGVDVQGFRPASAAAKTDSRAALGLGAGPVVLYYGHLSAWKGVGTLVDAFAKVSGGHNDAQLVIAHTSYGRGGQELNARIARHGIGKRVRILGLAHVPTLLAAADIVALPTIAAVGTACHPNVLLESLAAGVAVVSTRTGSIPEAVRDGETALLAAPADAAELGAALARLLEDESLRRRLGQQARKDAVERFDWAIAARRVQAVYHGRAAPAAQGMAVAERDGAAPRRAEAWA